MDVNELLSDLLGRVTENVHTAVDDLDPALLTAQPADGANTIGWLVWHLTRVQDSHVAEVMDTEQLWVSGDFAAAFGVPADPENSGYGHSPEDVAAIRPRDVASILAYYDAVAERTASWVRTLGEDDLDRVVDRNWDPPVTLGVRLVSVIDDDIQHSGQAAYVRGLVEHDGR